MIPCVLLVLAMWVKADFSDESRAFIVIIIVLGVCSNLIKDCINLAVVYWINHKTSVQDIILMSHSEHSRAVSLKLSSLSTSGGDRGSGTQEEVVSPIFSDQSGGRQQGGIRDSQL